jgi:broad specificity phosphatase PhoE
MNYPDLLILRHGQTEWNLAKRVQGELDSPLTPLGRAQAAAQGRLLASFGIAGWDVWTSPQGRAADTAQIALGPVAALRHDPRLAEITMGHWSGLYRHDIAAEVPHLFETQDDLALYDHAPDGEGLEALYTRTGSFLAELTRPSVIVTHGITSRMLRCHALGLDAGAFDKLPGGQGVVFHLSGGQQTLLSEVET